MQIVHHIIIIIIIITILAGNLLRGILDLIILTVTLWQSNFYISVFSAALCLVSCCVAADGVTSPTKGCNIFSNILVL